VIARPVSNPYLAAVGLSQTGSVTLNYGAEATTPVRGTFLNTTDAPLAYILVRPASTRTVLNDDGVNAVIIDARRSVHVCVPRRVGRLRRGKWRHRAEFVRHGGHRHLPRRHIAADHHPRRGQRDGGHGGHADRHPGWPRAPTASRSAR
jgi:hypothetical protein